MDQIRALEWVRDNVRAFGGDASRVTFGGQSSGGTSAFALLAAPSARGLFHRVWSMSGSANLTMDLPTAEAQNQALVAQLGCGNGSDDPAATVRCLRAVPADRIVAAIPGSWDSSSIIWN